MTDTVQTAVGEVPRVETALSRCDRWGAVKARWGVGRMSSTVVPGLYAAGDPDPSSPVLVTANYTMSFDRLRAAVAGLDAWLLVLDTNGINVWCAAGHGSFGTTELVRRIEESRLASVVEHRRVILPQLGAPGVAAHEVKKASGFKVVWGPVMAEDLPAFVEAGYRATETMRRKRFPLTERAALVPMELVHMVKPAALIVPAIFLLGGLGWSDGFWPMAAEHGGIGVLAFVAAVAAGAVITPLLLPWLPGRAFSAKGTVAALAVGTVMMALGWADLASVAGRLEASGWLFLATALAAFLAMNFTGASTYTSLSGVRREMRIAVPLQIAAAVIGVALCIGSRWAA